MFIRHSLIIGNVGVLLGTELAQAGTRAHEFWSGHGLLYYIPNQLEAKIGG